MSHTVSIITPCYNGAKYLRETIESVLEQTFPALEMIVIDDGSTDDSAAIAESFGAPVKVLRQENQGESVARNKGIAIAQGSHLLFLDADDLLKPDALKRLTDAVIDDERAVALMGYSLFLDGDRTPIRTIQPEVPDFLETVITSNPGAPHCYLTPKSVVQEAGGFHDSLVYFEDWDFYAQVALTGVPLKRIDYVGALYRRHPGAQTPSAKKTDRKLGHVKVLERLLQKLLENDDQIQDYGERAFWSGWAALRTARDLDISWKQLTTLTDQLEVLMRRGPESLKNSKFGRVARWFGLRWAMRLQKATSSTSQTSQDNDDSGEKLITQLQNMQKPEAVSSR